MSLNFLVPTIVRNVYPRCGREKKMGNISFSCNPPVKKKEVKYISLVKVVGGNGDVERNLARRKVKASIKAWRLQKRAETFFEDAIKAPLFLQNELLGMAVLYEELAKAKIMKISSGGKTRRVLSPFFAEKVKVLLDMAEKRELEGCVEMRDVFLEKAIEIKNTYFQSQ